MGTDFVFPLRQHIHRDENGIWVLWTGTTWIPHPTWRDAYRHALWIHHMRTDALA